VLLRPAGTNRPLLPRGEKGATRGVTMPQIDAYRTISGRYTRFVASA